jgi:hypothetical protein
MRRALVVCVLLAATSIVSAGAESVRWVQAETEHFLFVFEPRDRASVDELLTYCEPVYERITGFFHSYPKKVPVIVRGRVDAANGFTSFLPARIELYLTAPTDHFLGARTESWLKILLTHELTHFVHASMDRGFFFTLSRVFGGDLSAAGFFFLPGWMIEGPSTNMETRFTEGGRGRNPLFEMQYEAPVEEGKLFSLEQGAYGSAFPPADRIYVAGYVLVDYILTTYGVDSFRRIMEEYLGFPFLGPWGAIRKITGKSASQVFDDLKEYLAKKYTPSLARTPGVLVTPKEPGNWTHPQLTDRGLYVSHSSPYRFAGIVRLDPATGREQDLQPVVDDGFSFTATRDGRMIYFTSMTQTWADPGTPELVSDLYSLDVDTRVQKRITRGAHLWQPAVSPDGKTLVAVQGMGPYSRLVSVDTGTGSLRVLYSRTEGNVYTPAFSPDGRKVAFTFNLRGYQDVLVADYGQMAQGSTALEDRLPVGNTNAEDARAILGPDPFGEYFPSFMDDETVLFSSDRGGAMALYRADLGTGKVARIHNDPVAAISAIPDGNALLYSSYSADGWCLKRTPVADLAVVRLGPDQIQSSEYPAANEWTGESAPQKPYVDWPSPLVWLPVPSVTRTSPDSPGIEIGLGAAVLGTSLLGRTQWAADAAWFFASQQPQAALSIAWVTGPFTVSAQSQLAYQYSDTYTESIESSLTLGLPVLHEIDFDTQKAITLFLGVDHRAQLESTAPFTFAQSAGPLAGDWQNALFVTSGVSLQWRRDGGRIDFDPPLALTTLLQNSTRLPVLDYPAPESAFLLGVTLNIPSFVPHNVFRLGLKATDVFGGPFTDYKDSFAAPRGFPGPTTRKVSGQALASIDYRAPIALLDQPLLFSFAATGASIGVHAEGIALWDNSQVALSLDPSVYTGGDFTLHMVFNAVPFVLVIGAAVRIDTSNPGSFDAGRDLGVYLSIGQAGDGSGLGGSSGLVNGPPVPVRGSR